MMAIEPYRDGSRHCCPYRQVERATCSAGARVPWRTCRHERASTSITYVSGSRGPLPWLCRRGSHVWARRARRRLPLARRRQPERAQVRVRARGLMPPPAHRVRDLRWASPKATALAPAPSARCNAIDSLLTGGLLFRPAPRRGPPHAPHRAERGPLRQNTVVPEERSRRVWRFLSSNRATALHHRHLGRRTRHYQRLFSNVCCPYPQKPAMEELKETQWLQQRLRS